MKRSTCSLFALLFLITTGVVRGQNWYDKGDFVIRNDCGVTLAVASSVDGIPFGEDLEFNPTEPGPSGLVFTNPPFQFYRAPNTNWPSPQPDPLSACQYRITFSAGSQSRTICLNMTDANWKNPDYRLCIIVSPGSGTNLHLEFEVYDIPNDDPQGQMDYGSQSGYNYWDLVYDAMYPTAITRDRNGFTITGNHAIPTVTDATLDVNVLVDGNITVPDSRILRIKGYGLSSTNLYFHPGDVLTVEGSLLVTAPNTNVNLWAATQSNWGGVLCTGADSLGLTSLLIDHATVGLAAQNCPVVFAEGLGAVYCSSLGMEFTSSIGAELNYVLAGSNGGTGILAEGDQVVLEHFGVTAANNNGRGLDHNEGAKATYNTGNVYGNQQDGVAAREGTIVHLYDLNIHDNTQPSNPPYAGVYAEHNNQSEKHALTIQSSRVWGNQAGLRVGEEGRILAYFSSHGYDLYPPVLWPNGFTWTDSLGRNCIFDNHFNLYASNGGVLGMAVTLYDNANVPYYYGRDNSIYDAGQYEAYVVNGGTVLAVQDWWDDLTTLYSNNSILIYDPVLPSDPLSCVPPDEGRSQGSLTARATVNATDLLDLRRIDPSRSLEGITPLLLQMPTEDARRAMAIASAVADPAAVERWCTALEEGEYSTTIKKYARAYHADAMRLLLARVAEPKRKEGDDVTRASRMFVLGDAYPNPCNPSTQIAFALAAPATVHLTVHNALGREVAVLADGTLGAGRHLRVFNASMLPSGMYFTRLTVGSETQMRTLLVTK